MRLGLSALFLALLVCTTAAALSTGEAPPPIDMPEQNGKKVDLEELRARSSSLTSGRRGVRPASRRCRSSKSLHKKYAEQGLVIVGVNIDNSSKKMNSFLKGSPVGFRIVHDPKISIAQRYEPSTMPSSYFIGRDGKLRYVHEGFRKKDAEEIEKRIKALLAEDRAEGPQARD